MKYVLMIPLSLKRVRRFFSVNLAKEHKNSKYKPLLLIGLFLSCENHHNVFKSAAGFPLDINERCNRYLQVL
jgi:hypothetical protein